MRTPAQRLADAFGLHQIPYVPRATLAQPIPKFTGRVLADVLATNSGAAASHSHGQDVRQTAAGAASGTNPAPAALSFTPNWRAIGDGFGTAAALLMLGSLAYALLVLA